MRNSTARHWPCSATRPPSAAAVPARTDHETERRSAHPTRPPTPRRAAPSQRAHRLLSWCAPLGVLLTWELVARCGVIQSAILPMPSTVVATATRLWGDGELQSNMLASLRRALLGFAAGASCGLALGALVGLVRFADAILDRSVQMIRAVPFLAIMPLVVIWFGIGEVGKVFLVGLASLFPLYLNTVLGIRQVDPKLLEMGRVFGLSRGQVILHTVLPGALPSILNGVRTALTTSWLALVGAESLGASAGIGFLATNAREFLQTDVMVLVIVLYALIGMLSDLLARLLERRLLAWHPNFARPRG